MKERRVRIKKVIHRVGLKKSTIYKKIQLGEFPRQLKDGNLSYWLESELDQWVAEGIENHMGVQKGVQKPPTIKSPY